MLVLIFSSLMTFSVCRCLALSISHTVTLQGLRKSTLVECGQHDARSSVDIAKRLITRTAHQ